MVKKLGKVKTPAKSPRKPAARPHACPTVPTADEIANKVQKGYNEGFEHGVGSRQEVVRETVRACLDVIATRHRELQAEATKRWFRGMLDSRADECDNLTDKIVKLLGGK